MQLHYITLRLKRPSILSNLLTWNEELNPLFKKFDIGFLYIALFSNRVLRRWQLDSILYHGALPPTGVTVSTDDLSLEHIGRLSTETGTSISTIIKMAVSIIKYFGKVSISEDLLLCKAGHRQINASFQGNMLLRAESPYTTKTETVRLN